MNASIAILRPLTEFPAAWPVRTAASFAPFITSGSRGWARYYAETGDLFLRITNLDRSSIYPDLSDRQHVALPVVEREGLRTRLKEGDILISITADIGIIGYVDDRLPLPAYINQHVACLRLPQDQVCPKFVAYYLSSKEPQKRFVEMTDVGAKTGINLTTVSKLTFPCPPLAEQQAIAAALSDADGVVAGWERVIAKKRLIKQGAMQDLLTARRRLPGFSGEWVQSKLGAVAMLQRGFDLPNSIRRDGDYPVVYSNGVMASHAAFMCEGPGVVTGRSGTIGNVTFVAGRYWPHNTALWVKNFFGNSPRFIYYLLDFIDLRRFASGSGVPTLNRNDAHDEIVSVPKDIEEQNAICTVLDDMDADIQTLEARLAKAQAVKEGMMQNLLTGRVRLV